ncbi:hypothetical protein JCM11491_005570 [Sporobolomyces phaffii]
MGKTARNTRSTRYDRKLAPDKLHKVSKQQTPDAVLWAIPIASTVSTTLLAISVAWVQAQSKDLLPKYVMAPAIIGAVCAGVTAVLSLLGFFQLKKGNGYHAKQAEKHGQDRSSGRLDATRLKHQSHPFYMYHWLLFGTATAMLVTVGSYLYMLICLVLSEDYCVAFTTATSKDDCKVKGNNGVTTVIILLLLTVGTAVLLYYYHSIVKDSLDYFDYQHLRFEKLGQRGGSTRGGTQSRGNWGATNDYSDDDYKSDFRNDNSDFRNDNNDFRNDNSDFDDDFDNFDRGRPPRYT